MNGRELFVETLTFGAPERIPFTPGWGRESTTARWHREGLPEGRGQYEYLCEVLGIEMPAAKPTAHIEFDQRLIPQFEETVLEHKDGHYVVQDWKGNICEIADTFDVTYLREAKDFVTRRWVKCPVETREDWEQLKPRYALDAPGRFGEEFEEQCRRARDREQPLEINFSGPFWQLREWCGFEGLCMLMIDDPEFVDEMATFWKEFVAGILERILAHVTPDSIHLSEDMAYKAKSMISMDMARRFCMPCWHEWGQLAKEAGTPIYAIDSDGFIGELIPLWIEAGVNACDPIEVAAHCDIVAFREAFGHRMAYRGGVDKRCIARGGQAIRDELKRLEPVVRDGGYIPSCDHGVPHDVSWDAFVDYGRLLAQLTGWL
jgi:hypothetical protein